MKDCSVLSAPCSAFLLVACKTNWATKEEGCVAVVLLLRVVTMAGSMWSAVKHAELFRHVEPQQQNNVSRGPPSRCKQKSRFAARRSQVRSLDASSEVPPPRPPAPRAAYISTVSFGPACFLIYVPGAPEYALFIFIAAYVGTS